VDVAAACLGGADEAVGRQHIFPSGISHALAAMPVRSRGFKLRECSKAAVLMFIPLDRKLLKGGF